MRPLYVPVRLAATVLASSVLLGCPSKKPPAPVAVDPGASKPKPPGPPTVDEAKKFIADVDKGLRAAWTKRDLADWERSIDITDEHEKTAAAARLTPSARNPNQRFVAVSADSSDATRNASSSASTAKTVSRRADPRQHAAPSVAATSSTSSLTKV